MTKEQYVSFETAKLLKENGFDGECIDAECHMFYSDYTETIMPITEIGLVPYDEVYFAPTQQIAMRWLREVHKLHIVIEAYPYDDGCFYWCYRIMHLCNNGFILGYHKIAGKGGFDSYEEAVEVAFKYCLENLIND